MKKKKWEKPLLTVLVRSRAEEAVLAGCKFDNIITGPEQINIRCDTGFGYCDNSCDVNTSS